ncbi:MAG: LysM peptidoglycan-binding domain-containing protein [Deltaproteobacteria bacterium]|nr:LysM peptidoglycan-binding domain-containing protein [Deltaproteobacteria bacterium]
MKKVLLICVGFMTLLASASPSFALVDIIAVRHWTAPDYTRIVIDVTDEASYHETIEADMLFIDLEGTRFPAAIPHRYDLDAPAVSSVVIMPRPDAAVRISVSLGSSVSVKVFSLKRIADKSPRIVIDVKLPVIEEQDRQERERFREEQKALQEKVVVIDPGHGGEDPGAVGRRRRTLEKDVVLKIAKHLKDMLRRRGYKVLLTRDGDYYVSFNKRKEIARESGADLFLSIHADAFRTRFARGCSVYCLSTRGASTEAARLLADSQNLSDIIGGSPANNGNGDSHAIALNMTQMETLNHSKAFGVILLKRLSEVNHLKYPDVHEAPFTVLKLPEVPSVLVEVAYLSNPREEELLRTRAYQREVAASLAGAVEEFIPRPAVLVSQEPGVKETKAAVDAVRKYQIKRGDYLESIARRFNTTVHEILRLNNLSSRNRIVAGQTLAIPVMAIPDVYIVERGDRLQDIADLYDMEVTEIQGLNNIASPNRIAVGQRLILKKPGVEGSESSLEQANVPETPLTPAVHVVEKGDTLAAIARKYGTTIRSLITLNNLSQGSVIYAGQKLRLIEETGRSAGSEEHPHTTRGSSVEVSSAKSESFTYKVIRGDNLESLARRFNISVDTLAGHNGLSPRDGIMIGMTLQVKPSEPLHIVRSGENLETIARRYGTTVEKLMEINDLPAKDKILRNQVMKLPSVAEPI